MSKKITLDIVTQEKRLLTAEVQQITVDTVSGEITILPNHIPLVTRLKEGVLSYVTQSGGVEVVAVFGGFLELDEAGMCSVLADSAVRAEDIDLAKVERAKAEALAALEDKEREKEYALAEAALRQAAISLKASEKRNRHRT